MYSLPGFTSNQIKNNSYRMILLSFTYTFSHPVFTFPASIYPSSLASQTLQTTQYFEDIYSPPLARHSFFPELHMPPFTDKATRAPIPWNTYGKSADTFLTTTVIPTILSLSFSFWPPFRHLETELFWFRHFLFLLPFCPSLSGHLSKSNPPTLSSSFPFLSDSLLAKTKKKKSYRSVLLSFTYNTHTLTCTRRHTQART